MAFRSTSTILFFSALLGLPSGCGSSDAQSEAPDSGSTPDATSKDSQPQDSFSDVFGDSVVGYDAKQDTGAAPDAQQDSGQQADSSHFDSGAVGDSGTPKDSGAIDSGGSDGGGHSALWLAGANLSGGEFGKLPGTYGKDYIFPSHQEIDYFYGKGMRVFRLPFRWERLQPVLNGPLQADELARIDDVVKYATGLGAHVILDPHNYARYNGKIIGTTEVPEKAFGDLWSKLAAPYKNQSKVIFGLMNEPNNMVTATWLSDNNAAIAAIRATGAKNLILVPGNAWSGAHSWYSGATGTSNATVMLGVVDPANNFAFEVHQYLDTDSSGTDAKCVSVTVGRERVTKFTGWLREHGYRGFIGEFAGGANTVCEQSIGDLLTYIDANRDVWMGWTWWAAGPWWGEYMYTIEPKSGVDRPQMSWLLPHLN